MPAFGIYIHIPFCLRKCSYCDFYSLPLGRVSRAALEEYPAALVREAGLRAGQIAPSGNGVVSVYFGGGTPTCLPAEVLAGLLREIQAVFPLAPGAEVTVEANPGTIDTGYLAVLANAGFNRLSLGAQAWQEGLLRRMGRIHGPAEIVQAVEAARLAGFANIGIDLMYGLPGQSLIDWRETLTAVLDLGPQHVSVYGLTLAADTPWGALAAAGGLDLPGEDQEADMLDLAAGTLERAGLERYEIANYARPGWRSRHNQLYWLCQDYLGLGPAAASRFAGGRYTNRASLEDYLAALGRGNQPPGEVERLDRDSGLGEAVFLGLRLLEGIDLAAFAGRYGGRAEVVFAGEIARLAGRGLLEIAAGRLRLTRRALPVANEVFQEFVGRGG